MWRLICVIVIVVYSVASLIQADIWLTNGVESFNVGFMGDVTGDGASDYCNTYGLSFNPMSICYKNVQDNENPIFQKYKNTRWYNYQNIAILRKVDDIYFAYFGIVYFYAHAFGYCLLQDECTFSIERRFYGSDYGYLCAGNDMNDDGIIDCIIKHKNIASIMLGKENYSSSPFPDSFKGAYTPKDQNNNPINLVYKGFVFIADIDDDNEFEVVVNDQSPPGSDIYEIDTLTDWIYSGRGEYICCIGDWDEDGYCDIVYHNGRVQLGVPETNCFLILLFIAAGILQRKRYDNH